MCSWGGDDCPYKNGLPRGVNLHDFQNEVRQGGHPGCQACRAVTDQNFGGYIMATAYFPHDCDCPKTHGVIRASGVHFKHASSISLSLPATPSWSGRPSLAQDVRLREE